MQELVLPLRRQPPQRATVPAPLNSRPISTPCVARVVGVDDRNRVLVEVPGLTGVSHARLLKGIRREDLCTTDGVLPQALVMFDGGCSDRPIIIGVLQTETEPATGTLAQRVSSESDEEAPAPERILIEALTELVLKCGAGSITVRKDGKIVLRGTHLLSRSSGPIRIKGGHVEIN